MQFTCNVCSARSDGPAGVDREAITCAGCGSNIRLRSLVALLAQELFGVQLALGDFPVLKQLRAIGMSDPPNLAERLAKKFDYTNTFYHQPPFFDVLNPDPRDHGRYDFIISSEVMEHVPQPLDRAFAALSALLKPDGLLLLTTPYLVDGKTAEHFPELHQYGLARAGEQIVLVNRRRDGSLELFDNLTFHGGPGETLELRVFTEPCLRKLLTAAGFTQVHIDCQQIPQWGIHYEGNWSLPIAARKGKLVAPVREIAQQYAQALWRAETAYRSHEATAADYRRYVAYHEAAEEQWRARAAELLAQKDRAEAEWQERSEWGVRLEQEKNEAIACYQAAKDSETKLASALEASRAELARLNSRRWTKLGRKLGLID